MGIKRRGLRMETWGRECQGLVETGEPVKTAQLQRHQPGKKWARVGSQSQDSVQTREGPGCPSLPGETGGDAAAVWV